LEGRRPASVFGYVEWLLIGRVNPAYYFVPLLIQFYLLSSLITRLAKTHWKLLLIGTGVLQLVVHLVQYPSILQATWPGWDFLPLLLPKWLFVTRIFWFCFGVVFGLHLPVFKRAFERTKYLALASLVGLFVLGIVEWEALIRIAGEPALQMQETVVDALYAGAFIWTFLAFSDLRVPATPAVSALGSKSFGIYLVHSPVMEYFSRGLYHLAPWVLGHPIVMLPALIVVGLAVPLVLMQIVSRSPARRFYAYQFG
jgi:peptidoglycan/LPS O-acetylase OafA/YrhL